MSRGPFNDLPGGSSRDDIVVGGSNHCSPCWRRLRVTEWVLMVSQALVKWLMMMAEVSEEAQTQQVAEVAQCGLREGQGLQLRGRHGA